MGTVQYGQDETAGVNQFFEQADTWLMGRKTYEFVVPCWDQLAAGKAPPGAEFLPPAAADFARVQSTNQGKVERFQQTMKKWLRSQPDQPTTIDDLQALLDAFVEEYNEHRPHRSLEHRATPATVYTTRPKATPSIGDRDADAHDRVRYDKVDKADRPARSPGATRARCTPMASGEPTPEPASSPSPMTSTSGSSTP